MDSVAPRQLVTSLVVTLYDRWRPVYDARFAAPAA